MSMQPPERLKPQGGGWVLYSVRRDYTAFQKGTLCALSSVCFIEDEHLPPHWEWLVSFSGLGVFRLNSLEIKECLKDFGIEEWEEDNHEPGNARKFWRAVDPQYRKPCPCKNEIIITEGDYQYSINKENHG